MEQFSDQIVKALGEWKIVKFLGSGQYGKVYEIQRENFGVIYRAALKVITIPASAEEVREIKATGMNDTEISNYFKGIVEDFVREFALMAKLKGHTNIVGYEDHQVLPSEDGVGWTILIRMELLTPLTDYVSQKQMTRRDVIKLGIDLCKALELCQRVNIIHRDIKPANIFVSEMGEYKLGDFGVARIVEQTMSGRTGTDTYMAPEVYYEEKYGSSADIYSLGIVMYRLLNCNRAPFLPPYPNPVTYRNNAEAFRRRINGEELEEPSQADGRLAEIVLKACAYRKEDRYSSPEAMRKELEAILYETKEAEVIYPNGDGVSAADGLSKNGTVALRDARKGMGSVKEEEVPDQQDIPEETESFSENPKEGTDGEEEAYGIDYHGDETVALFGGSRREVPEHGSEETEGEEEETKAPLFENLRISETKESLFNNLKMSEAGETRGNEEQNTEKEWKKPETPADAGKKKKTKQVGIGIAALAVLAVIGWAAAQGTNHDQGVKSKTEKQAGSQETETEKKAKKKKSKAKQKAQISSDLSGTVKVAAVETAYGKQMWEEVAAAFEQAYPGVTVELTVEQNLDDAIVPDMKAGNYPDVICKSVGSETALTETFTQDKNLVDLTDVLDMTVPGENVTVGEKILPGFTDNTITNPYGDGRTYLMPMFYSPCGLFYDAGLLEKEGWDIPKTWDEMWSLGDAAKEKGIALFTYPTTGYLDAFFYSLLHMAVDRDTYNSALLYDDSAWDTDGAREVFDIMEKLASYTHPDTPSQANDNDYLLNQQLVLDDRAIFMPNGNWVIGEMDGASCAEGFEWGFMALPAVKKGGERAAYSFFEQIWMPKEAKNQEIGKAFLAFLYSDEAADIFAASYAIQPIKGMSDKLPEGDGKLYYSIYDQGAVAVVDAFASAYQSQEVNVRGTFFDPMNDLVTGTVTKEEWVKKIKENSVIFREGF